MTKKQRTGIVINILIYTIGFILCLLLFTISLYFGNIDFDYELKKCSTLDSSHSSYDFTNTVEIDAEYNEECYYLKNHPYARLERVYGPSVICAILGMVFYILLIVLLRIVLNPTEEYGFGIY